jgi:hypothetical protein
MMQFLAAWGAVLSTLLASIKVYELWSQERVRLTASFFCSGRGGQSDKITITNLSKKPLHITSWKIVWRSVKKDLISLQVAPGRDFSDLTSFTIGSHASHLIEFSEIDKFDTNFKISDGRKLYIDLIIAGQKDKIAVPL